MAKTFQKGVHNVPEFYVKTGSELVNAQLNGGKGIPSGTIIQLQSVNEGSSKTTEALKMAAQVMAMGKDVAYVDAENRIFLEKDPITGKVYNNWLTQLGVDANEVYFVGAKEGEQMWEEIITLITEHNVKFVVLDSIHAARATLDYTGSMGDKSIGQHAALHQKGVLKVINLLPKHNAILCGINQRRDNITPQGKMGTNASGGKSWFFYSSYIFILGKKGSISSFDGKDYIPFEVLIQKNSGGSSYQKISTYVKQGHGIDKGAELAVIATELGLIRKAGSWWKDKDGVAIGQGDNARFAWAAEHTEEILALYKPTQSNESGE